MPFSRGEKLKYNVRWEAVKAGKANFTIQDFATINGEKAYHFYLEIKSNKYVDLFYKIRDRHEGFTNLDLTHSLFYKKKQSGKDKRDTKFFFDWDKKTVQHSNFGDKRDAIEIPEDTFDPLTAFYKMRTLDFQAGQSLSFPVTNGKKYFFQEVSIINRETIIGASGSAYDTYLVDLAVKDLSGVFEKSKNPSVKFWVSADKRKIPVRIKVKVFIGSVIFDLDE